MNFTSAYTNCHLAAFDIIKISLSLAPTAFFCLIQVKKTSISVVILLLFYMEATTCSKGLVYQYAVFL